MGQDRPINALLPGFAQVHVFNSTRIKPFIPVYMPIAMYLGVFAQNTPRSRVSACFHLPSTASTALHVLSKCQTRVSGALTELMKSLISGQTEAEAAGNAARLVLRGGGHVHMLAISHGPSLNHLASDPLAGFSQERPSPGDLARAWITGPMFQGYWLGPGRTVVCGSAPTSAQRALLEANAEAVDAMVAAIRPGITVRELVAIGDRHTGD